MCKVVCVSVLLKTWRGGKAKHIYYKPPCIVYLYCVCHTLKREGKREKRWVAVTELEWIYILFKMWVVNLNCELIFSEICVHKMSCNIYGTCWIVKMVIVYQDILQKHVNVLSCKKVIFVRVVSNVVWKRLDCL